MHALKHMTLQNIAYRTIYDGRKYGIRFAKGNIYCISYSVSSEGISFLIMQYTYFEVMNFINIQYFTTHKMRYWRNNYL